MRHQGDQGDQEDAQGERLVDYEREDWPQLQLAYAISSHRAQGSEWGNAVVVVSQSHFMMLQRNLLYTALNGARKRAVIVVSGGLENKANGSHLQDRSGGGGGQRQDRAALQRPR